MKGGKNSAETHVPSDGYYYSGSADTECAASARTTATTRPAGAGTTRQTAQLELWCFVPLFVRKSTPVM